MLSGGIGITPLRSMIKYSSDKKLDIPVTLFYSNRTPEEIAFREDFSTIEKENTNFKIVNTITNKEDSKEEWQGLTGFIDEKMIKENSQNLDTSIFYICGPPKMVDAMVNLLKTMNIDSARIKIEHFTGY